MGCLYSKKCNRKQQQKSLPINANNDCQYVKICSKDIIAATHDFNEEYKIGSGGFGEVYKGKLPSYGVVAIKRIKDGVSKEFRTENQYLMQCEHSNLVKLYQSMQVKGHHCLIMQYVSNGSLKSNLKEKDCNLNYIVRLQICAGIAKGIRFLHTGFHYSLIHRDIKTANILLDQNYVPKICDFGLVTVIYGGKNNTSVTIAQDNAGTRGYAPPEARVGIISRRFDIYSFGVVILEVVSGKANCATNRKHRYLAQYFQYCYAYDKWSFPLDPVAKWPQKFAWKLLALAKVCLEDNRYKRPDISSVSIHHSTL
ncbi:Leucine-rich repeat receptor protein kinase MSP1 [Trichoplax sp. H2]|uniref:Protein kinase domain-containing protein n=1 Tax=Trichoplax adhaerens TaxID=10228 RepID=B3RJS1_TRIAD|nr:hypothetical protein TRIADDRAFT_51565 [Trichoplax adhaerens]EDV29343.1 hypothetical protein TRIADDRAFT_51565 [Trichoplax adhaerens]RDD38111.1 Leucine-rich repeat receptor protein kinase MSP1 [Trichoplax sp. H2]|eukprot:XP_002108545.1 hypothetical protein TRIADDRAFT_51565 [Trichoplax adhaerens]